MQKIRDAQLAARRKEKSPSKDTEVALMTALVGEATAVGKNAGNRETTDEEALAVVRKFLKNAEETRRTVFDGKLDEAAKASSVGKLDQEIAILKGYMPSQMSEEDLRKSIGDFVAANPGANVGVVMKHLKEAHGGAYDGKLASAVAKSVLG